VKRTDAPPANWIGLDIEVCPKAQCFRSIQDIGQALLADVSQRGVEEARPHFARCVNDSGNPRRIATRRYILDLSKMRPEMSDDFPQLTRAFNDKTRIYFGTPLLYQLVDFRFQDVDFLSGQPNAVLLFWIPRLGAIKSGGGEVSRQK
jgi:hypothetical protein